MVELGGDDGDWSAGVIFYEPISLVFGVRC